MKKFVFLAIIAIIFSFSVKSQSFFQMNAGQVDQFSAISHCGNSLFLGTKKQILRSTNNGISWQPVLNISYNGYIYVTKIIFSSACGLAKTTEKKVFFTNDAGTNWAELQINYPIHEVNDVCFGPNQNEIFILVTDTTTEGGFILKSTDYGITWNKLINCGYANCRPISMLWQDDVAYIAINCSDTINGQHAFIDRVHDSGMLTTSLSANLISIQQMTMVGNELIFVGTTEINQTIERCIGKKSTEANLVIPASFLNSPLLSGITDIKVSQNYEAVFVNFFGYIYRVNLSGFIYNTPIDAVYHKPNSQFCGVDMFNSCIYAVGTNSLAITNNQLVAVPDLTEANKEIRCQNPFTDNLNLTGTKTGSVIIYSLEGKKIFEGQKSSEDLTIPTSSLPAGIYLLQIGEFTKKIVKK